MKLQRGDAEIVTDMMRKFYTSAAVITDGSEKIFAANVENCLGDLLTSAFSFWELT
ncbi:MAG: hypothetical protein IJ774_06710 [Selenomonadaceae bacterium]|nr:hypothetical protein [Selenomonadaceae bacterium]